MLSIDFIYQKAQDYMNWLFVSPAEWKDSLGDFMDLDSCAVHETEVVCSPSEEVSVNAVGNSRQHKLVLDRDSIKWQNIDGPQSLMIAWKKLIATSARFRQESKDFLCCQSLSMVQRLWNAVAHTEDNEDSFSENLDNVDSSFTHAAANNVDWTDDEEVNLDAAHVDTFLQEWDHNDSDPSQNDVFYDCDSSELSSDEDQ